jgi:hypothetical protein
MISMRGVAVLCLLQFVAGAALAQQAAGTSEFGRAGGDEISVLVKQPGGFSGSFGLSMSKADSASKQFSGGLGGALVADRLWFFTTAMRDDGRQFAPARPQLGGSFGREPAANVSSQRRLTMFH